MAFYLAAAKAGPGIYKTKAKRTVSGAAFLWEMFPTSFCVRGLLLWCSMRCE
jgi:hypothetical protein